MSSRRCVCGRSATFPLCDSSHVDEAWSCAGEAVDLAPLAIVSGPSLESLARRLAAAHQGVLVTGADGPVRADRLVVLTDGSELRLLQPIAARVAASARRVLSVGVPASAVSRAFPGFEVQRIEDTKGPLLWQVAERALLQSPAPPPPIAARWFLSHASADEALLEPALSALRAALGVEIFSCADSIASGARWQPRIIEGLDRCEAVLYVLSEASARSVFCAWELGWAAGRGVPVRVLRLDETPPSAPIQHLQLVDLPRVGRARPWLEPSELLLQGLVTAMG